MRARLLRVTVGAMLLLAGYMVGIHTSSSIHAQTMHGSVQASYGKIVAGDSSSLWFEDSAGTLRQVTIPSGNTIFIVTRR
jgi:hypothetical protein